MTIFSSLTPVQQAQAAYLFADELLGNDPTQYDYELNGEIVIGRSRIVHNGDTVHAYKPRTVAVNVVVRDIPDGFVRIEMQRKSTLAIQLLARKIVERVIQSQTVEA